MQGQLSARWVIQESQTNSFISTATVYSVKDWPSPKGSQRVKGTFLSSNLQDRALIPKPSHGEEPKATRQETVRRERAGTQQTGLDPYLPWPQRGGPRSRGGAPRPGSPSPPPAGPRRSPSAAWWRAWLSRSASCTWSSKKRSAPGSPWFSEPAPEETFPPPRAPGVTAASEGNRTSSVHLPPGLANEISGLRQTERRGGRMWTVRARSLPAALPEPDHSAAGPEGVLRHARRQRQRQEAGDSNPERRSGPHRNSWEVKPWQLSWKCLRNLKLPDGSCQAN